MTITITAAVPDEAPLLTAIAFAAKRSWGYPERWIALWRASLTVTPAFIAAHETFAARQAGRIIGFATLARKESQLCLQDLWVRPSRMGRGVGRALFRHAQRRGRELGFATFDLESDPHATGFYERMGAERIGTMTTTLEGRPRHLPVFRCSTAGQEEISLASSTEATAPAP
jgi:GNAT superfamily N-acetyltransferase